MGRKVKFEEGGSRVLASGGFQYGVGHPSGRRVRREVGTIIYRGSLVPVFIGADGVAYRWFTERGRVGRINIFHT